MFDVVLIVVWSVILCLSYVASTGFCTMVQPSFNATIAGIMIVGHVLRILGVDLVGSLLLIFGLIVAFYRIYLFYRWRNKEQLIRQ